MIGLAVALVVSTILVLLWKQWKVRSSRAFELKCQQEEWAHIERLADINNPGRVVEKIVPEIQYKYVTRYKWPKEIEVLENDLDYWKQCLGRTSNLLLQEQAQAEIQRIRHQILDCARREDKRREQSEQSVETPCTDSELGGCSRDVKSASS